MANLLILANLNIPLRSYVGRGGDSVPPSNKNGGAVVDGTGSDDK